MTAPADLGTVSRERRWAPETRGEAMKLYDYKMAPNPRRVRVFAAEKGLQIPLVEVDLGAKAQMEEAYRTKNPQMIVPALELDDGTLLTESVAICRYLEELHPTPNLFGDSALERAQVEMWNRRMEQDGLAAVAETFRNTVPGFTGRALPGPHDYDQIADLAARGRTRVDNYFDDLNAHLATRPFVAGDRFTIADITAYITVDFAKVAKKRPDDSHPALIAWRDGVAARPSAAA